MKSDSLQGIIPFVQVVEAGSLTLAAERIRVTTSAVVKSIARMERRLGVRLLNRSTRRLSLTSEGEAYYKACVAALAEIDAAQAQLAAHRQVPSGRLRIDPPLAFGRRCVVPVLFEIVRRYPGLALEATFNDRHSDLIEEGFDLTIRLGELRDSAGLVARKLFVQRSTVCASPAYLKSRGRPADIDEFAQDTHTSPTDGMAPSHRGGCRTVREDQGP
jgi:DNA-binding transcriptional LysR family regulator